MNSMREKNGQNTKMKIWKMNYKEKKEEEEERDDDDDDYDDEI